MDKPHSFAGRVVKKYGKHITNDYPQPDKFFNDMADYYKILDGVPFSAIEDLAKYESNRDIIIKNMQKLIRICIAANLDATKELERINADPFDGLEEDLALKKKQGIMKISGEV